MLHATLSDACHLRNNCALQYAHEILAVIINTSCLFQDKKMIGLRSGLVLEELPFAAVSFLICSPTYMHMQGLLDAVRRNDMDRVRNLMSAGMGLDAAPHPLPPMTPPLIEAVCCGHRDMVKMLLDRKASLNARDVALGTKAL